jgi:hypothetical protein
MGAVSTFGFGEVSVVAGAVGLLLFASALSLALVAVSRRMARREAGRKERERVVDPGAIQ